MTTLFEFQKKTINIIVDKFKTERILVLLGEKDTGKSVLAKELGNYLKDISIMFFEGNPSIEYVDFGCFPKNLLEGHNTDLLKRSYINGIKKDIAATVANILFVSVENTLDSFLSSNEKSDISDIIDYIINLSGKQQICLIFDNVEFYDKKTMVFLYNIVSLVLNDDSISINILLILNQTKTFKQTILTQEYLNLLPQIYISTPTDNDLSDFLDANDYSVGYKIPIKYLLDLNRNCKNLNEYYLKKLNNISKDNAVVKRLLYMLVLLDEPISFNNLTVFLSDLPITQLFQSLQILKNNSLIEWHESENNIFYAVPELVKSVIKKEIPLYLSLNRYEVYVKQIEQHSPLDYIMKYWLYSKAGNIDNACANAILSYCGVARGEINCTNEELKAFDYFLQNSLYAQIYAILRNGYRLYNMNEYEKCFNIINNYLVNNHIIMNHSVFFSVFIPEFIFEMIFLRGMCIGRLPDCSEKLIRNQQQLLTQLIQIVELSTQNEELILRMREQRLLLKTYLAVQSRKEQKDIYNEYFSICTKYQHYIRESTTGTRKKWEIKYASLLLKANIVSGIPDKLYILEKGYRILEKNKELHPTKYLKAACNLAGDYMWRDQIDLSHEILKKACCFIEDKRCNLHWGVIFQMYIFSKLYASNPSEPKDIYNEYLEKVWDIPEIRFRMHETAICSSNYAILLASIGKMEEACEVLENTLKNVRVEWNHYIEYLLSTNLGVVKYILGDISNALKLEKYCSEMIEQKIVPTFSQAFIKKRNHTLLNIYDHNKKIDNVLLPLNVRQTLSTGYCSDNYLRPLLFSDINYWAD